MYVKCCKVINVVYLFWDKKRKDDSMPGLGVIFVSDKLQRAPTGQVVCPGNMPFSVVRSPFSSGVEETPNSPVAKGRANVNF